MTTNCGHHFDLRCFMDFCSSQSNPRRVACPCCRQAVSLLFSNFDPTSTQDAHLDAFRTYNAVNGVVQRSIKDIIFDVPELIRQMLLDRENTRRILSAASLFNICFLLLLAVGYLISPFDIIPESLFGVFGFVDDFVILVACVAYITILFRNAYIFHRVS